MPFPTTLISGYWLRPSNPDLWALYIRSHWSPPDAAIAVPPISVSWHVHCGLDGACLTKDRLAMLGSTGIRNGRIVFFPCALKRPFLASQESLSYGRPPLRFGLQVRADRPRSYRLPSRPRWTRPEQPKRITTMATIGSFTASGNGFSGTIKTLNLNVKATIRAVERTSEKGPDYRILAGATIEFGAAWKKTSNEGRDYLSVKLDDPSFPAPIYATLIEVEGEEGLSLIWSRSNRD